MSSEPDVIHDPLLLAALLDGIRIDEYHVLSAALGVNLDSLLADDLMSPDAEERDLWRLSDLARAEARQRLDRAGPRVEIALRKHIFTHLCALLETGQGPLLDRIEQLAFEQLARLFVLLYLRLEWQLLMQLCMIATPPRDRRYQQRLRLYRAFVAVRTGDYSGGRSELEALLASDDLELQVRLDATIAFGHMWRFLTKYDQALQTFTSLSELALAVGMELYHGQALFNLGTIYNELERYEQALDLVLESRRIFADHGDSERLAYACYSVGLNAMYLGRWVFARAQYEEAIALFERLQMPILLAAAYWGQGFLNLMLGDRQASEVAYRKAIALATETERSEYLFAMDSWWQLGILLFTQGRNEEAVTCYDEGLTFAALLHHEHRAATLHFLRGRALQARGRDAEATAAYDEAMAAVEVLRGAHQEEAVKIGVLGTAQQVYEAAALHALALGQDAEAFDIVERARARAFLDSLAARAPELFARFDHPTVTLAEVQAALPAGALLLAYYTTGVLPTGEHFYHTIPEENAALKEHLLLPPRTVLFAITRDSLAVHRIDLNPNLLSPQPGDPRPGRHLVHERRLAALYERLLGPVAARLASCASLFVVPHGPLHYVPFMALRSRDGAYLVRAGGPAVAIAPSTTILVRNCLGRPAATGGEALAVGYNGRDEAALRFAEPEARLVARALGGRALTGEAARAEALLSAGPLRALHIAGHAAFHPDAPLKSALELAGGDRLTAHTIMGAATRAELVVLSACTSGLSHVVPGDELLGLQRAWLYAGAAAVVCALWEAADLVTLLVMERFYAALAAGQTPGPALRDAVVAVRGLTGRELRAILARWQAEDSDLAAALPVVPPEHDGTMIYADPIHWAPFMLIGRA